MPAQTHAEDGGLAFILEIIRLGLTNLRLHLLRSILTTLGIIFGVGAVITMVAIGEGQTREALTQIERLGARNIIIRSQQPPESAEQGGGQSRQSWVSRYGLTYQDLQVIRASFPEAEVIVPLKQVGGEVSRGARRRTSQVFGTTPDFPQVSQVRVERGRYLTQEDISSQAMVAVIGKELARTLFPFEDPLNNTFRIDGKSLTIVGVLAPVGLSGGAGAALVGRDLNLDAHIPLSTAQVVFGDIVTIRGSGSMQSSEVHIAEIYVASRDREDVIMDAAKLRRTLDVRHPGLTDIGLIVPFELLAEARKRALAGKWIAGMIAGISLLVGGIGIMNIMLATVTERTREIGIRRALGATRKHIIWQFLVETSVLSTLGGLVGVIMGLTLSIGLALIVPRLHMLPLLGRYVDQDAALPTYVTTWSVLLSFIVAMLIGLVFGLYPARKAAKQDPIVALRHD
jgi:putative ABC transport system permease protein